MRVQARNFKIIQRGRYTQSPPKNNHAQVLVQPVEQHGQQLLRVVLLHARELRGERRERALEPGGRHRALRRRGPHIAQQRAKLGCEAAAAAERVRRVHVGAEAVGQEEGDEHRRLRQTLQRRVHEARVAWVAGREEWKQ
jgi:hypothetical protein